MSVIVVLPPPEVYNCTNRILINIYVSTKDSLSEKLKETSSNKIVLLSIYDLKTNFSEFVEIKFCILSGKVLYSYILFSYY